mgnify:CR=1 FL=1
MSLDSAILSQLKCIRAALCQLTDVESAPGTASEVTLTSLNNKFIAVTRTPALLRVTGAGAASVTAGKRSVSFLNVGSADAIVLGETLGAGEFVNFEAGGEDDVLGAISYNALTSTLLIKTVE